MILQKRSPLPEYLRPYVSGGVSVEMLQRLLLTVEDKSKKQNNDPRTIVDEKEVVI